MVQRFPNGHKMCSPQVGVLVPIHVGLDQLQVDRVVVVVLKVWLEADTLVFVALKDCAEVAPVVVVVHSWGLGHCFLQDPGMAHMHQPDW